MTQLANASIPAQPISTRPDSPWFDVMPKLGISSIDHLFNRLDGAYPFFWRNNFPDEQSIENWKESWVEIFEEQGITFDEVKAGLKAVRIEYEKPPTLKQFLSACRPTVDPYEAYQEAIAGQIAREQGKMGKWSSPAVYWSAVAMWTELRANGYQVVEKRWAVTLKMHLERRDLAPIPAPNVCPALGYTAIRSDENTQKLEQELKKVWKRQDASFDHLSWARKILSRVDAGDRSVPLASIKNAREALGVQVAA